MANVPADLPGITFLSGGQSDILATAHLDAMNKIGGFSWKVKLFLWKSSSGGSSKSLDGQAREYVYFSRCLIS